MQIMVPQGWVDRYFFLAPNAGFTIPNLPVVRIVAVVNDVPTEGNKRGFDLSNSLDQRLPGGRIGRFRVFGIVKSRISIRDKTEWSVNLQLQGNGLGLRGLHLRVGTRTGGTSQKSRDHEQSLKNPHSLPHDKH